MKKTVILLLALFIMLGAMSVCVQAGYATVSAVKTVQAPNIDGYMDPIYEKATAYKLAKGEISAEMYIAYDDKYIYVYADIKDKTPAETGTKYSNITAANRTDAVFFGYNLKNMSGTNAQYNGEMNKADGSGPNTKNDGFGVIALMRGAKDATLAKQGGHAFLNTYKCASLSFADHYTVELRLEFGVDVNGDKLDTAAMFADGISIMYGVHDSPEGSNVNENNGEFYHASDRIENMRGNITPYTESDGWDKLEFGQEFDIAPATAPVTTPAQVSTAPKVTAAVTTAPTVTALVTTAQATTPTTTPASTTPASTTPASTTPASTTPAETAPVTTAAVKTEQSANTGDGVAIVVSAPTVIVIMAVTQVILVVVNAILALALIKAKKDKA